MALHVHYDDVKDLAQSLNLSLEASNATAEAIQTTIWRPEVVQRVISLVCIMVISIFGNTVIIAILSCSRYRKRSRVNMLIMNLAIADLAVCFVTMTTEITFVVFGEWIFGPVACKLLTYLQVVTLSSTTFILTSMAFDRFEAICTPLQFRPSIRKVKKMVSVSWVTSFIFAIPQLLIFVQTVDEVLPDGHVKYGCRSQGYTANWQRKTYISFIAIYSLVLPAIFYFLLLHSDRNRCMATRERVVRKEVWFTTEVIY